MYYEVFCTIIYKLCETSKEVEKHIFIYTYMYFSVFFIGGGGEKPTKSPRKGRQRIDHTDETRSFYCRNPHSKLRYFQTLLALGDLLTSNPIISSEQPQSYYELVIRGVKCDADSGDKAYRNQLKQLYGKKIPALPAPDPDFDVFAVEDGDDCEFDVAGSDDDAA